MQRRSDLEFPRQNARTRRFALGVPRDVAIAADGSRLMFLRARSGTDPCTLLWQFDVAAAREHLLVDPQTLLAEGGTLPAEERARRERHREAASGVVRFSSDRELQRAVFDLEGRLYTVDASATVRRLPAAGAAVDPRIDASGQRFAYVCDGALHVITLDGEHYQTLMSPEAPTVRYGLAEHVAAEEMGREHGYWWSPDGSHLAVARVDVARVQRWHISDPADPQAVPRTIAYPAAGTVNADVSLHIVDLNGTSLAVQWDRAAYEYLARVEWSTHGLRIVVQSRNQHILRILDVDPGSGSTTLIREDQDDCWVDLVDGLPARLSDGSLVWSVDSGGAKRLVVGSDIVTEPDLEVRSVADVDGDVVLFRASREPTEVGLWTWSAAGGVTAFPSDGARPGVDEGWRAGGTTVVVHRRLELPGAEVTVHRGGEVTPLTSLAETPVVTPSVTIAALSDRQLRSAILFPTGHAPGSARLPVLLDPYGGPAFQKVTASANVYLELQWFADQGFAVLVVDGRGTPGRGPRWSREVRGDRAMTPLEDQVDALHAAAARWPDLDLTRVAIRGWSYGGFLAALAVLRRPDVFHCAVAGAPVTDQRMYDTHYTERYLGHPDEEPDGYERSSLLGDARRLERPLMIIHGLSDDNVVVAHSFRLSAALFAAGRPHAFLPLPGVTHSTNREEVAEQLLLLQLDFIRRSLPPPGAL